MATEKQVQTLKKLAGIAGKKYDWNVIAGMENGDIDQVFDEIRVELDKKKEVDKIQAKKVDDLDSGVVLGMCFKKAIDVQIKAGNIITAATMVRHCHGLHGIYKQFVKEVRQARS
jgi:hypothetical protein